MLRSSSLVHPNRGHTLLEACAASHRSCALPPQDCFDLEDARRSYFQQLFPLNPGGIVPSGPTAADLGLDVPAGRGSGRLEDVFYLK